MMAVSTIDKVGGGAVLAAGVLTVAIGVSRPALWQAATPPTRPPIAVTNRRAGAACRKGEQPTAEIIARVANIGRC